MPHLQLDTTADLTSDEKRAFADAVTGLNAEHMRTGTDHVAVTIRERKPEEMSIGRAVEGPIAVLGADVREGRPLEQKRAFALGVMDYVNDEWGVPRPNLKAVFTEHRGSDMMGSDRVGSPWSPDEAE